jgi:hypothetical protein
MHCDFVVSIFVQLTFLHIFLLKMKRSAYNLCCFLQGENQAGETDRNSVSVYAISVHLNNSTRDTRTCEMVVTLSNILATYLKTRNFH